MIFILILAAVLGLGNTYLLLFTAALPPIGIAVCHYTYGLLVAVLLLHLIASRKQ